VTENAYPKVVITTAADRTPALLIAWHAGSGNPMHVDYARRLHERLGLALEQVLEHEQRQRLAELRAAAPPPTGR
jgi:pyrroloquinoline quinone (PQQ) biosynthesis protein C